MGQDESVSRAAVANYISLSVQTMTKEEAELEAHYKKMVETAEPVMPDQLKPMMEFMAMWNMRQQNLLLMIGAQGGWLPDELDLTGDVPFFPDDSTTTNGNNEE